MPTNPDKTPSPNTLDEAVNLIVGNLSDTEVEFIKEDKSHGSTVHFSFGMSVRNGWGLWKKDSPLSKHFQDVWGLGHADDMSGMIIYGVYSVVRGETPMYQAESEKYKRHWKNYGIDPLTLEKTKE